MPSASDAAQKFTPAPTYTATQLDDMHAKYESAILEFARRSEGTQIGTGQCWDLLSAALLHAHARTVLNFNFGAQVGDQEWYGGVTPTVNCRSS